MFVMGPGDEPVVVAGRLGWMPTQTLQAIFPTAWACSLYELVLVHLRVFGAVVA